MAELSAEERYNNADMEAFDAYCEADSEYQEHIRQYNACLKEYERIINSHTDIYNEITEKAQTCNEAREKAESLINVVVIGVMNHGKSTMLNALLNNTDDSLFKVADKRETREIQREERENICWTDTPGFDADEDDNNKALAGITQLEVGLFVHRASVGELHANEVEVLRKISKNCKESFLENTCIVLNDDICNDEQLEKVFEKISEQLDKFLDASILIFVCNPKSYQKGLRENKKILAGKSGIAELRAWIEWRCEQLRELKDSRIDQTSRILEPEIRRKCKIAIEKLEEGIHDIEQQILIARTCSDNLHKAIKKISFNKDRIWNFKLSNKHNNILSPIKYSMPIITSPVILPLWDIIPKLFSSDFDKECTNTMENLRNYIQDLHDKKNDIAESIRDFKKCQDELKELSQNMRNLRNLKIGETNGRTNKIQRV